MQDLGDDPRAGRRRLSTIQGERGTPTVTPQDAPVVPAQRLLKVATALSEGATKLHEQLRHLEPSERDALLELVADQVTEIVSLWADLVRGVVSSDEAPPADPRARAEEPGPRSATPLASHRPPRPADDHPARLTTPEPEPARARVRELGREPVEAPPAARHEPAETGRDSDRVTRDELTGVLNRQAGFAALGRDIDRCRRSGERFVLGYLNVDRMKVVNDARGSRAGDEVLRKVTAALRATLRSYDVIARLGGDEFLFSLPGSDIPTAELRFKEFAVILAEEAPGSTASVGFADLHEHDTLDDLIAAAESAMLKGRRARRRGRG
ncbi:MAG TPA: diguanylate cyclase [Acidimicrobiales bacterium]|nr:diguanylate cyclase [Acidimicrobiales bacterium]